MVSRESKILRLERELHRIRTSPSLRLGSIITDAMRRPWLAPFLILTLPWNMLMIGFEMLGKKSPPAAFERVTQDPTLSERNCVVIFPTNGVGFGHFTRMLALAKHMKKEDPTLEIIFFTTMPTLHLLKPYGIPAHYISGSPYFDEMSTLEWNGLLEEELAICFEAHRPKQFIFDGAFPYRGMLRAIKARPHLDSIWRLQMSSKRHLVSAKWPPSPTWTPLGSSSCHPRAPKMRPRGSQNPPKSRQATPRDPQEMPKSSQEPPKSH